MNDWGPELCNLLRGSFWVKAAFVPWERVRAGPPAPPGAARAGRPFAGDGNPLLGAAPARRPARRSGAAAPPSPVPGSPYRSRRDGASPVLSGYGGHTLVGAGQPVLFRADPPHCRVETEPEFLVVPRPTRPENRPGRSAPEPQTGTAGGVTRPGEGGVFAPDTCLLPRHRQVPLSRHRIA